MGVRAKFHHPDSEQSQTTTPGQHLLQNPLKNIWQRTGGYGEHALTKEEFRPVVSTGGIAGLESSVKMSRHPQRTELHGES